MAVKKLNDLIGLDFKEYQRLVTETKITYSEARLIPSLKTGGGISSNLNFSFFIEIGKRI
jgi:hypothetical protein